MDYLNQFSKASPIVPFILFIWSILWKGIALWKSAKYDQRNWFIGILVLNTIGIVEIIYLFYFCKKRLAISSIRPFISNLFSKK